ncbi:hypothetical protein, partial [Roseinatronobacter sp.]|uniref:hypothetical protein n=1 Tax=Roseinatronobacter sp. TaxID=1945755 RepID=UPI0025F6D51D
MANLFARERFNPQAQKTSFEQIEDIARKTRVPVNVLIALGEKAKVEKPEDLVEFSRRAAGELGPVIQSGGDIEQIIRQSAGDQAESFLARAREIGHELYPERMNPGQAQRNAEAAAQGRRSVGENIRLGVPQVPEGIVGGVGRTAKFLGFDAAGDAIIDFAENTFGMSEEDQARSAAIAEDSTIGQEVVDGFFQAGPGILVDIAMSWAGAKTGAKIGAIAGPKGAVVGGIAGAVAGAAASIFPQMVSSAWQTAEANGFDTEDQGVQFDIMKTALATSAAQTVFPAAVGRMLQKPINVAAEGVARSVIQRAAAGAALGSGTEGMAEVTALVLEQIMFDKDVQASLDAEGWKAVGPMLIEKFGREAVVTFGIGALMGGAIGGPAAAVTQRGANAQIDADSAQAQDGAFGAIFERAQDIEPGSIQGVSAADHSAFMRGVLNEINGVEAGLTDADGNYDAQGRTARQQRAYDKGVAWANEQAGDIADG